MRNTLLRSVHFPHNVQFVISSDKRPATWIRSAPFDLTVPNSPLACDRGIGIGARTSLTKKSNSLIVDPLIGRSLIMKFVLTFITIIHNLCRATFCLFTSICLQAFIASKTAGDESKFRAALSLTSGRPTTTSWKRMRLYSRKTLDNWWSFYN